MKGEIALKYLEENKEVFAGASDKIWEFAEVGLQEHKSAKLLQDLLRDAGFELEAGVAGMPTAFIATWGEGKPVIGFLGEYDALPGCSQKVSPIQEPVKEGAPGHGCGHNLLGVGSAAAAIAAKEEMAARGIKGTLKYFGCPAEELGQGKIFMSAHDCFAGLDCALTWHSAPITSVRMAANNAKNSAKFRFYGKTAHAGSSPHTGRSALDACILMDVATNYLREHIIQEARIHSVITHGGGQPNVVPDFAEIWYYVRAPKRYQVEEIYSRVVKNAEGAALMTETRFAIEDLGGIHEFLRNRRLGQVMQDNLVKVGPPKFNEKEERFAAELAKSVPREMKEKVLEASAAPRELMDRDLYDGILLDYGIGMKTGGSDDTGDVSYQTPLAQLQVATRVLGAPGHAWQTTATQGMSIGHKGMMCAAGVISLTALDLLENPGLLKEIRDEFREATRNNEYQCSVPKGAKPNLNQVRA